MNIRIASMVIAATALTLAGCSEETALNFTQPAGAFLDEGQFGNATMNNTLAQKCSNQPKGYIVPDPIVVLDPNASYSPKSPQPGLAAGYRQGRIQCSGNLNGKYAKVIFDEYVDSATMEPGIGGDGGISLTGG
ncbi:hypothetical protein [Oceaniglobus indicus]|uniref:hypothetical protein n=1 Tax=Oceaniglobus indicus TaxID=2047749 RepID=UPI0011AB5A61|nr:hypothetical protein [Oceaniglobus indicus]